VFNNAGLCGDLVSVGSVGTSYSGGISGTALGTACPSPPPPPSPPYAPGASPALPRDNASESACTAGTLSASCTAVDELVVGAGADRRMPHRAVAGGGYFVVDSGACTVASSATCFRSPNYPSDYANYESCTITVAAHEQVTLSVVAFSTESGYDKLTVNSVQYSGATGPGGVQVAAGSTITFTSDGSTVRSGFEVCGEYSYPQRTRTLERSVAPVALSDTSGLTPLCPVTRA
jgi:hypothetical protein